MRKIGKNAHFHESEMLIAWKERRGTRQNPISLKQWVDRYKKGVHDKRFWRPLAAQMDKINTTWLRLQNIIERSKQNGNN